MKYRSASLLVFACLVCVGSPARATWLEGLSLAELVRRSQAVVLGRVVRTSSQWRGRHILTRNVLEVREVWRGSVGRRVVVYTLGGRLGRLAMRVVGAVALRPGQDVVLFLSRRRLGYFVTGMVQGALFLRTDRGRTWAVRRFGHVRWTGGRPRRRWDLGELRRRVLSLGGPR